MQTVYKSGAWFVIATAFMCVLFADFLPLPFGAYASQRFVLVGLLALAVAFPLTILLCRHGWSLLTFIWPALLFAVGFILLAIPFRQAPYNWVEPGMYAAFFLGFVLTGCLLSRSGYRQTSIVALVTVAAVTVVFYGGATITVYLFALSDQVANLSNYIPWGFVNIRYWSHIATWLLPLLPLAVFIGPFKDERLWRFLVALGAALWWWVEFLSASRGSMLGIAFGVIFAGLLIGRPALPWLRVSVRYLAYGVVAWLLLSVVIPSVVMDDVSVRSLHTDSSGRMPLFVEAWRMSLENAPLGMGPQSWLTHEILTDGYKQSHKFGHPHNMYLMWAAEYGWLLIGALILFVGQAVRLFWHQRTEVRATGDSSLALSLAAFTASVSAALLHAGVSAVFIAPGSMLIGFLVLSVFWALITSDSRLQANKAHSGKRLMAAFVVLLAVGGACAYWLSEVSAYHEAMEEDLEFYYENVPEGTLPRFWFHGNFPREFGVR
jgi:O-antigen ligase